MNDIVKLIETAAIGGATPGQLLEIAQLLREREARRSRILKHTQECLTQLRLDMAYLLFDRDCLKRELDAIDK